MLHLIRERPRHGYELIKAIEEATGGAYSPSPGVIYPTLTLLDEVGHVTIAASDGSKNLHHITAEGEAHLAAYKPTLDALFARLLRLRSEQPAPLAAQVHHAMENFRLALATRLERGGLTDAQADAIATAIEAATAVLAVNGPGH